MPLIYRQYDDAEEEYQEAEAALEEMDEAEQEEQEVEEVEDLLEYYLQRAANTQAEAERLLEGARDLEESIGVSLSARRFEVSFTVKEHSILKYPSFCAWSWSHLRTYTLLPTSLSYDKQV